MADQELDPSDPSCLHLVSAFLAMDSTESLISLSRVCGGGSVTEGVQRFIWDHCLSKAVKKKNSILYFLCIFKWSMQAENFHAPYLKNFLKKLIAEIELNHDLVLDELYEQYAYYMASLKDDNVVKGRICKCISFLFPAGSSQLPSCPNSGKLVVPLRCSLNMLDGDTGLCGQWRQVVWGSGRLGCLTKLYLGSDSSGLGMRSHVYGGSCALWPSSLFLSEFILSFPGLFSNKSCFELGSGVGLVGICLAHVEASKVALSDGDLSTLMNMKLNLESNNFSIETNRQKRTEDSNTIECIHLPWESASENELQDFMPDVILGADVIYDPACLPYLVRLLAILLNKKIPSPTKQNDSCQGSLLDSKSMDGKFNGSLQGNANANDNGNGFDANGGKIICNGTSNTGSRKGPVAYIASVIRNIDTFNHFLSLVDQANITITDLTETHKPLNLLPYMQSYDRSNVRLFVLSCK
uniref:FAM86 N-terminal domain-containing protein n=1 Tax=Quercus lobata TaxID=97700 RepID=A0A7N2L3A3_QUELO